MILQIKIIGKNFWDGSTRVIATDGHGWIYEGGINDDLNDTIANRKITYFKAELGEHGIEIGDEVIEQDWKNQ